MRLETWPTDPTVGHLVVLDHDGVPDGRELEEMLDRAWVDGYASVRTSALFPGAADAVLAAGFVVVDSLALLRVELDPRDERTVAPAAPHRVQRLWAAQHGAAAEVDRLAFGPVWGYDARNVAATRRATPAHRARRVGRIDGYAIAGAGGTTGYLQRLAVRPDRRRRGIADALVADALGWMRARGVSSALVNTGVDNVAALRLYERHGFHELPDRLTVAETTLTGTTGTTATGTTGTTTGTTTSGQAGEDGGP